MILPQDIFNLLHGIFLFFFWGGLIFLVSCVSVAVYQAVHALASEKKRFWASLSTVISAIITTAIYYGTAYYRATHETVYIDGKKQVINIKKEREEARRKSKEQLDMGYSIFHERCKNSGIKIYQTAEDVEGILLLKVRPGGRKRRTSDPMWEDAASLGQGSGQDSIQQFLTYKYMNLDGSIRQLSYVKNEREGVVIENGYQYVDVKQEDGSYLRYSDGLDDSSDMTIVPSPKKLARYAVTYENEVNPEDRKYWVAGTTVKIIDMQTEQLMAEKVVYAFAPEQGKGPHTPWSNLYTCPKEYQFYREIRYFVDQVLKPKQF